MRTDELLRGLIRDVLAEHAAIVALAVRQRAKFEGWLKFELAAKLAAAGGRDVTVEASLGASSGGRADLAFRLGETNWVVELKTCNTNWRQPGVASVTRPITKNISEIVADGLKLQQTGSNGVVAFCMFPVAPADDRWVEYLQRIGTELRIQLTSSGHSERVRIQVDSLNETDIVVVALLTNPMITAA